MLVGDAVTVVALAFARMEPLGGAASLPASSRAVPLAGKDAGAPSGGAGTLGAAALGDEVVGTGENTACTDVGAGFGLGLTGGAAAVGAGATGAVSALALGVTGAETGSWLGRVNSCCSSSAGEMGRGSSIAEVTGAKADCGCGALQLLSSRTKPGQIATSHAARSPLHGDMPALYLNAAGEATALSATLLHAQSSRPGVERLSLADMADTGLASHLHEAAQQFRALRAGYNTGRT